ncbi:MAG: hypothetical protein OEV33_04540 [Armatimonadota bacterium]|nr:hypothetical protein [Armatimonadota bacterium]
MGAAPANEPWLLLVYVVIGFAVAVVVLGQRTEALSRGHLLEVAAETGVVGGVGWWLIIRAWGLGGTSGILAIPVHLAVRVIPWGVVVGLFAAWRMERAGVPAHQTADAVTQVCGAMVLLFLVISGADLVINNWR